jgi:Spy/CpxP family protein refolding chaperone
MRRNVTVIALIFVFLAFGFFPSLVFSQAQEKPGKEVKPAPARPGEKFLELTAEQKAKLDELRKMQQEERKEFMENMRAVRQDLDQLLRNPEADQKEIDAVIDKMAKLRASHLKKSIQHRREVRKIFTPEQLEKMARLKPGMARDLARMRALRGRFFWRGRFHRLWRRGPMFHPEWDW